ncbi:MAG: phenylacetate--CoA ligase [Oscillospiraceae bacterium]|jgi:phenylacetate-CoA ligase|nr:phenylacetate--CoA ligase [Oscillospiraceae bacterium]
MKYYMPEIECAPRAELDALQSYRLSKQIRRVYENVAPYRHKMDAVGVKPEDIKSVKDLSKLPFTLKQDLRDNYPYGMFATPLKDVVRIHASSGTTGKQTVVGYSAKDVDIWAECAARALVCVGGDAHDFVHVAYGYGLFTGGLGMHYGAEKLGATAIPASAGNSKRQLEMFRDFGSTIVCMTPSYAISLIELMQEVGIKKEEFKLKAGLFGAEPWTEEMRAQIEEGLGLKAYDIYGLSEISGPSVSTECTAQKGMHVCEDHFIPEIIDPDTLEPLPPGQQGELVFTCITKETFPLIRYRTRDVATLTYEKCECGRTLVRMLKPQGRTDDMLIIRGVNVFPSQIESAIIGLDNKATNYLIEVDRINNFDTLTVVLEMREDMLSDTITSVETYKNRMKAAIDSAIGVGVNLKLVEHKTLARSMGKAVRVVDNREIKNKFGA